MAQFDGALQAPGNAIPVTTPDAESAAHHRAALEQQIGQTREELEHVVRAISDHEDALHALRVRQQMLINALSVVDGPDDAAPMEKSYRGGVPG